MLFTVTNAILLSIALLISGFCVGVGLRALKNLLD